MLQKLKCKLGFHIPGWWEPAVGGRDVRRCKACDKILEERSAMNKFTLPKVHRPKGKESDKWFQN